MQQPPVLALDIGGTKLAVAVVSADGSPSGLLIEPTDRAEGPDAVIKRLFDMAHRAVAQWDATAGDQPAGDQPAGDHPVGDHPVGDHPVGDQPVAAVGISCGGPLDAAAGVLLCPPHLPGWVDIPLGQMATREFDVPFVLENDATAAALGEYRYGAGRGTSTMLYLTISTGVGGGAVIDGRLHRGAAGNGGEFGHVMVDPGGRRCSCGRHGCVEAYASGSAIAERAAEAVAQALDVGVCSVLAHLPAITAADVVAAAADGDELAVGVWTQTTDLLGTALTDLVNVFEPDLVVLGGGVTRAGAMLLDPVRAVVAREAMGPAARAARIELSALGDSVGVVGAGAVAMDLFSPPHGHDARHRDAPSRDHALRARDHALRAGSPHEVHDHGQEGDPQGAAGVGAERG